MKLLVDEARQDEVAHQLDAAGHDVAHVRLRGLGGHTDDEVMALAIEEDRVLVTTDTDFGTILAVSGAAGPSVLLLRGIGDSVNDRVDAILGILPRTSRNCWRVPWSSSRGTATASGSCQSTEV